MIESRLLSRNEAHKFLCISRPFLDQLIARREIPTVRIGRRVLFDPKDLQEYIERQKRKGYKQ